MVRGSLVLLVSVLVCAASPLGAQTCLEDSTGDNYNCTANDVSITSIVVKPGGLIDGCTSEADTATVDLRATIEANQPTRYDVGFLIALDGGDALTGSCLHDFLGPALSPPGTLDLASGSGPYRKLDPDACGDIQNGEVNVKDLGILTIPCTDDDSDNFVDIGTVSTWDQNVDVEQQFDQHVDLVDHEHVRAGHHQHVDDDHAVVHGPEPLH